MELQPGQIAVRPVNQEGERGSGDLKKMCFSFTGDFIELKECGFLFMVTLVIQLLFLRLKILKKNYFKSPNQPQRGLNLNHNSTI